LRAHALYWGALALVASTGQAQEAKTAVPPASSGEAQLEAVTVTAERRRENAKDVPISVFTLRGDKLDAINSGGGDIRAIAARVPSLNIESSFGRAFPRFYLRGYGNTDFHLNASQPVSLVYDDVVQENPLLKGFPAFDLRSIEVLEGPQGTLFGRNTPAGVVKFDSVEPSQTQQGYASLSYGRYGTINAETAFNLPMTGDWSARLSVLSQHRDDWVKNTGTGPNKDLEGYDDQALRAQLLYKPGGTFSALFNAHGRNLNGTARLFRGSVIQKGTNELVAGFDASKVALDGANLQSVQNYGGSARLKWLLDGVTLYSVTGYETVNAYSRGDVDGTSGPYGAPPAPAGFPVETADGLTGHEQLTQEFRAESSVTGPLAWQGGLYLFHEKYIINSFTYDGFGGPQTGLINTAQWNNAVAAFGSVNYAVTPAFKVRGGLRYTWDKKSQHTYSADTPLNATAGVGAVTKDSKANWDLSGTYVLTPQTNVYGRVATGFRGSSIQPPGNAFFGGAQSVAAPETTLSYEAGVKTDLFAKRARLAANLFHYDVKNLQLSAVGGATNQTILLNAKKAAGQGAEMNLDAYVTDALLVTMSGSYNVTKLKDPGLAVAGCGGGCTVTNPAGPVAGTYYVNGNPLPQAPKWVANLTARYSIPTAAGNEFYVFTDWAYRSKVNFFLYQSIEFTGKSLTEGGLRAGYIWGEGKYEAAAFVRNITNQIRVTGAIDFNNLTGFINDPRTWGVQGRITF
jgi:iron complex outermembrane receptor protein